MFAHDHKKYLEKYLAAPLGMTAILGALATLGSPAAHAGATAFNATGTASQVGPGAVTTPPYPGANGDNYGAFSQTVGGNTLTFSAAGDFTRIDAPFDVDYPLGTALIQTADAANNPTGPLQIAFSQGVGAFGVQVQDYAYDSETFTLQAFDGATSLGTFSFGPYDNSAGANQNKGMSIFVGAKATNGDVITKVDISSLSKDPASGLETMYSNDFFAGPVTFGAPVPEASTLVSGGMGLFLFAGLLWGASRRKKTITE